MTSFILASGNAHKAEEFRDLFSGVLTVTAAPKTLEVDETGKTYTENAFLKAKAYFETYGVPALADDSGLNIESLPDILGVQSARFAPELPNYADKGLKVIELLKDKDNRRAYFVCVLCFYLSPDEVYFFEGRVHGEIGFELKGDQGFGYDPIFIPERRENDGLTLAQLPEWKNEFSHRAKASQAALQFFKESIDKTRKKL
ncbi:RdgB/HAM1 family non-canonical purine NTP pyrophosphatase [Peredibacter starrii]|uniref:dITP/XTP pyrophosphatase n=1 Tax=Peredibacter starrii TaxID=28202 RepID=A0AAX4HQ13_9BACT|nr:RdgB/HAM1 family non-canonical purine NTP pyrophosphatase [Peredibacter starrii]WPU65193.1 RdgB/HAM1 family non-canonical purine NTP pyrophosphatase [Peredibacter starrii]